MKELKETKMNTEKQPKEVQIMLKLEYGYRMISGIARLMDQYAGNLQGIALSVKDVEERYGEPKNIVDAVRKSYAYRTIDTKLNSLYSEMERLNDKLGIVKEDINLAEVIREQERKKFESKQLVDAIRKDRAKKYENSKLLDAIRKERDKQGYH